MNLSEYLTLIYPFLANSKSHSDFLVEYFDWCIEEDTDDQINNPLSNLSRDYLNRIYNGSRDMSKTAANKVLSLLNRERHSEYFEANTSIDALDQLDNELSMRMPVNKTIDTADICFNTLSSILSTISRNENSISNNEQRIDIRNIKDLGISIFDGKIIFNNLHIPSGNLVPVPEEFSDQELIYISALFDAYTDEAQTIINKETIESSQNKYKVNFSNQRENFYSAESVSRFVRDGFLDGENHFTELIDETYDGITDTVWADYDNGYLRLNETLKHVSTISLNGAILNQIPRLINNKVRKGICHILVNDKKIKWVQNEE